MCFKKTIIENLTKNRNVQNLSMKLKSKAASKLELDFFFFPAKFGKSLDRRLSACVKPILTTKDSF